MRPEGLKQEFREPREKKVLAENIASAKALRPGGVGQAKRRGGVVAAYGVMLT